MGTGKRETKDLEGTVMLDLNLSLGEIRDTWKNLLEEKN